MEAAPPRSARHAVLVHLVRLVQAETGPLHPLRRAHHRPLSRSSALTHGEQPQPSEDGVHGDGARGVGQGDCQVEWGLHTEAVQSPRLLAGQG